jgi:hypothetical protein
VFYFLASALDEARVSLMVILTTGIMRPVGRSLETSDRHCSQTQETAEIFHPATSHYALEYLRCPRAFV